MADLRVLVRNHQNWPKFRSLEQTHASLDDDIADMRLIRGPWCPSRIPPEIICEIFHFSLDSIQNSVWTLSQVCRAWRRIAFGCPTLWNTLRITSHPLKCSNAYRSFHPVGWDCHVTELQAARAIRRTRETTLEVELDLYDIPQNPNEILRVLRVVAGQNLARWTSLLWFGSSIDATKLRKVFRPAQGMTSLQHLHFRYDHYDLLLPALIAGVPRLSSLWVTLQDGEPPTMLMDQPWLGRLKKLTLEFRGHGHPQLARLGPMVEKCKALEELNLRREIHSLVSGESFDSPGWPPLPRGLRTILLHAHTNFWHCVSSVNVTSLALRMENNTAETLSAAPRSISLPSLTKLECFSCETAFTAGYLLDAPNTQSMSISHYTLGSIKVNLHYHFPDEPWGIYPINAFLQTRNPHRKTLQDLFLRLSKTTTLSLCCYSTFGDPLLDSASVDPLLALIPSLESRGDTVVCPNLTRVELEFKHQLSTSEVSRIDDIIRAIQDTRGHMGLPRPSVTVRWEGCYSGIQK